MTPGNDGGGWRGSSPTNTPTESTIMAIAVIRLVFQHVQTKKPFADQAVSWVEVFKDITWTEDVRNEVYVVSCLII